ncbi:MAG: hypothetical protein JWO77_613 [Ilumatobacteraceae bacterium]|nr:hypothetical protein [Ilumatobacteraceae bacterium]
MAAPPRRSPHPLRSRFVGAAALAAVVLGAVAAPAPAGADGPLQAPVMGGGYAGSGQQVWMTVDGPAGAVVELRVAASAPDGDTCTKAMSGPGVTALPAKQVTLDADGHAQPSVSGATLTAGQFAYATVTSGTTTTAVSNCVLLGAGPPQDVHTTGVTTSSATASWTPTAGAPGQYARLMRRGGEVLQTAELSGTADHLTFSGLAASYTYMVSVVSIPFPGDEPPPYGSQLTQYVLPPFRDAGTMTAQQYRDLLGREPTATERYDWISDITLEGIKAKTKVDGLVGSAAWSGVQSPVIRVYRATLGRWPDTGGLDYWATRHRGGTSVRMIATVMSQSSEFKAKYGGLANRAFVERVYLNVLGRQPDRAGLDYWTRRLDVGALSRGELIVQFSASNEFVSRTSGIVGTINAFTGLLRRTPTAAELDTWGGSTSPPRTELIAHLFGTDEYAERITP